MDSVEVLTSVDLKVFTDDQLVALTSKTISDSCLTRLATDKMAAHFQSIAFQVGRIAVQTGSTAELYITPQIPCTGDIDIMAYNRDMIVALDDDVDFLISRMKNNKMADTVKCLRLVHNERYAGFVHLELTGELRYCWRRHAYIFHRNPSIPPKRLILSTFPLKGDSTNRVRAGPALNVENKLEIIIQNWVGNELGLDELLRLLVDYVICYNCPFWPNLEWKIRERPHGFPDRSTVDDIVRSGCDVVEVSHTECREDDTMMRLSFSRAEVALLNKWSHTQQVVFHMLRYFAKKELTPKDWERENKILCTYHMKTLMLWSCESNPREFWDNHVIEICCSLLKTLSSWLQRRVCQNYFVPDCNLFSHIRNENNLQEVIDKLRRFESGRSLAEWFHANYIKPSTFLSSRMLRETSKHSAGNNNSTIPSQECFSNGRGKTADTTVLNGSLRRELEKREFSMCLLAWVPTYDTVTLLACEPKPRCLSRKLAFDVGKPFADYATALQLLILAKHLTAKSISSVDDYRVYDYIATLYRQFEVHEFPVTYPEHLPLRKLYFIKAEELMSGICGQTTDNEDTLLTELSIQCLKKSLSLGDPIEDDDCPVSTLYLAALYFKVGHYQKMHELCSNLLAESASTKRKANGRLLIFVKDIATILGFARLWSHVEDRAADDRVEPDLRFTPQIFAAHLLTLCRSTINATKQTDFPEIVVFPSSHCQHTVPDKILMYNITKLRLVKENSVETLSPNTDAVLTDRTIPITEENSDDRFSESKFLIDRLMEIYFERLGHALETVRVDFGSRCFSDLALTALYRYRCRDYEQVMLLCDRLDSENLQNSHELDCLICRPALSESVASPVDLFFDDDLQAVTGFGLLVQYFFKLSPFLAYPPKDSPNLPDNYHRNQPTIELESSKIVKAFIRIDFLAKYLKLRCVLDTNRPVEEIIGAYSAVAQQIGICTMVERAAICFVSQKLRKILKSGQIVGERRSTPQDDQ